MNSRTLIKNRLKELRSNKNLSRPQVCKSTGIPLNTLKYWELGKTNITIENIRILADFYGVSIDYIAGRTDNPEINK